MSDSPAVIAAAAQPSQKRPLEEPSSPSGAGDQPEAKRPALDKTIKSEAPSEFTLPANPTLAKTADAGSKPGEDLKPIPSTQNGSLIPATQAGASQNSKAMVPANPSNGLSSAGSSSSALQDESQWLHIRSIISSAEAATVIGKGGENVTLIRRMSGAKCTVSDYARGAVERVLTVSGPVDAVAKVNMVLSFFFNVLSC
jgi:heterogeneous nuclear rnp K-like protein 2